MNDTFLPPIEHPHGFIDLTAKGRDEKPDSPQDWVRYHDEYTFANA